MINDFVRPCVFTFRAWHRRDSPPRTASVLITLFELSVVAWYRVGVSQLEKRPWKSSKPGSSSLVVINRVRLTTVRGGGGGGGGSVSTSSETRKGESYERERAAAIFQRNVLFSRRRDKRNRGVSRKPSELARQESFELSSNKRVATGVKRNYSGRRGAINNECSTNDARALPEYHLTRPDDCSATQK